MVREGEGSACWECGGLIVDLALIARPAVDYKVLLHLGPPEETGRIVVAFVGGEMSKAFMDSSEDKIP